MKRPGNLVFSILSAVLLTACTSYIEEAEVPVQEPVSKLLRISSTDTVLTSADASIVALMERHGAASTKSNNMDEIDDIVPIYGDEGDVLMYAVNFRAGGYTIVSATKDYYPVLAEVETGRFSDDIYKTGASVLMQEYREGMKYAKTLPRDSILSLRALWMKYEEPHTGQWVATKSNDPLFDLVNSSIEEWIRNGISFTFLSEGPPKYLPENVYQNYVNYAAAFSNPDYDYLENCVIIEERTDSNSEKKELMTTKWGQEYPYNYSIPNGDPAGCCAIALAQIMAYHQFPIHWDWNAIYALQNPILGSFIYEVASGINTNFDSEGSGSNINNVRTYLEEAGYNVQKVAHSASSTKVSLNNNQPVYMRGGIKGGDSGHAWVCDGYRYSSSQVKHTLLVLSYTEPLKYEPCMETYTYYGPVYNFFHMNWGWYGQDNGYFSESVWPSGNNYSSDRQDLINVYPK